MNNLSEWLERAREKYPEKESHKRYMLAIISEELKKAGYKDTKDTDLVLHYLMSLENE